MLENLVRPNYLNNMPPTPIDIYPIIWEINVWWNSGRNSVWDVSLILKYMSIIWYLSSIWNCVHISMDFCDLIYWQNYDVCSSIVALTNLIVCRHIGRSMTPGDLLQGGAGHSQTPEHRLSFYMSFCCTHIGNWLYNNCLCFQSERGLSPLDMFL